ncbi:MAG: hypothetical protein Q4E91_06235 [Lachnospiraceae bacterium]|nr:hypothetical protein [Lachnospiraceae bacterium]
MRNRTIEELKRCLKDAWPVECMAAHGAAEREIEEIGIVQGSYGRWYKLFSDKEGGYWYRVMIGTENGVVSEYEAVFGHKRTLKRT